MERREKKKTRMTMEKFRRICKRKVCCKADKRKIEICPGTSMAVEAVVHAHKRDRAKYSSG